MEKSRPQSAQKLFRKDDTRRTLVQSVFHPLPPDHLCLKCDRRLFRPNQKTDIWKCAGSCEERYRETRKPPSAQPHPADEAGERNRVQYSLYCATFITREERRVLDHLDADIPSAETLALHPAHRDQARLKALSTRQWPYPEDEFVHAIIEAESSLFRVAACARAFQEAGAEIWLVAPFAQLDKVRRTHARWQATETEITRRTLRRVVADQARAARPLFQPVPSEAQLHDMLAASDLDGLYARVRQKMLSPQQLKIIYEDIAKIELSRQSTQQYHPFLLKTYACLRARGLPRRRAVVLLAGLAFVHVPGYQAMQPAKRRHGSPSSTRLAALVHCLNAMIDRA
jgi:ribosomal protein L37AE/L43A